MRHDVTFRLYVERTKRCRDRHGHPDLIVTDWMMPGVDSVAFCGRLGRHGDGPNSCCHVVMLPVALPPAQTKRLWDVLLRKPTPLARLQT
ncbi:hypothetical protein BZM27_43385 [Paraburkholderia steynii]|uniref:Response regulatory domain-containing protein n=1 Tax=Paraburkholderia steynii TaxID=1245441 RepID=A0A4R0X5M0_9BURK|nr:hypothetical protein BZM27_43385 [Paraburkholderia steynii]